MTVNNYYGYPQHLAQIPISNQVRDGMRGTELPNIPEQPLTPAFSESTKGDFPDSNTKNGNTMTCLEHMLLETFGQGHLGGAARDQKLAELKNQVIHIKGKLLKSSNQFNAPVVVDTYTDSKGDNYYKFLITWEIKVRKANGAEQVIQKKQWTITGIKQPFTFGDSSIILYAHHHALLAIKCHLYIHKAAFNPDHQEYQRVHRCRDDILKTDLVGLQGYRNENRLNFTTDVLDLNCKNDPDSDYQLSSSIRVGEPALALCVALRKKTDEKVCVYIDQAFTGRRLNEQKSGYIKGKTPYDSNRPEPGVVPLCLKRQQQAHAMIVRGNPELSNHIKDQHAEQIIYKQLEEKKSELLHVKKVAKEKYDVLISAIKRLYKKSGSKGLRSIGRFVKASSGICTKKMAQSLKSTPLSSEEKNTLVSPLNAFKAALSKQEEIESCIKTLNDKKYKCDFPSGFSSHANKHTLIESVEKILNQRSI